MDIQLVEESGLGNLKGKAGAARVYEDAPAGFMSQFNRVGNFPGGPGVDITVTGVVRSVPVGVYRLRCQIAGTVKLWDNASAGSGTVLVDTISMSVGQVIELGELVTNGVFATVTTGTYKLVVTQ